MHRWFVGKVRFNDQITPSPLIRSLRKKYPKEQNFDIIEIYNGTVANDPSPPSKAVAVIHRSSLNDIACTTSVYHKILDYNNRDFYTWQTQRLLDTVAEQWLKENGGGVQLTVNRDPSLVPLLEESVDGKFNRFINHVRGKETAEPRHAAVFANIKSTNGHSLWKNVYERRFFKLPIGKRAEVSASDGVENSMCRIPGLSVVEGSLNHCIGNTCVKVLHVNRISSTMYVQAVSGLDDHEAQSALMKGLMRDNRSIEGVLLSETLLPGSDTYHSFSIHKRVIGDVQLELPILPLMLGPALLA